MTFKIPDTYERKWLEIEIMDGVLKICYPKDQDDIIYIKNKNETQDNEDQPN